MSSSFYLSTDVNIRLENPKNLFAEENKKVREQEQVQVKTIGQGQSGVQGNKNGSVHKRFSPEVKGLIGALGNLGTYKEVGKEFGIAETTVGHYANGKTADGKYVDPKVKEKVEDRLSSVRGQGVTLLQEIFERIQDPSKLDGATLKELSSLMSSASSVVDKLGPKGSFNVTNQVGVMLFTPRLKSESDYEVIDAEAIRVG